MPLHKDILTAIPGDNPGGRDLRYQPVYDKIREARREDDDLPPGEWKHERKVADHSLAIKLASDALVSQSKDLQIAAWMTESMLRRDGYPGLVEGLNLCSHLIAGFWDHLYPELEDGDAEMRAAPLEYIGGKFDFPLKSVAMNREGHDFYKYKESRAVVREDQATTKDQKTARESAIKSGKMPPEVFDKAFNETPKAFYAESEKNLDAAIKALTELDEKCREKFADAAPSFGRLRTALDEVRHVVHGLLQKKRESDPDPVVAEPAVAAGPDAEAAADGAGSTAQPGMPVQSPRAASVAAIVIDATPEPAGRKEAIDAVIAAAAYLRHSEPTSPAPYLMLRGLRWGELRAAIHSDDQSKLEAPPTELRRTVKQLALSGRWNELIETAENAMALPCTRAWLDLQRLVVDACIALGPGYELVALAIRSELRALVRDVPQICELSLMDDTPAANRETLEWLRQLADEPQAATPRAQPTAPATLDGEWTAGWRRQFVDTYSVALQLVRGGQEQKGFELLHSEIHRQRSGRARFQKRLQFAQLCSAAGKDALAQPMLEDLLTAIETHKLEEWEDRDMLAAAIAAIMSSSKRIQGDAKEKQKLYERVCRLNPVQALSMG